MDTWALLCKELEFHGITLLNHTKCQMCDENGKVSTQGVMGVIRDVNKSIKEQKRILLMLWNEVVSLLSERQHCSPMLDEKMVNLFLFSLKDMIKFLLCFEGAEKSKYYQVVSQCLNRDINSFDRHLVHILPSFLRLLSTLQ